MKKFDRLYNELIHKFGYVSEANQYKDRSIDFIVKDIVKSYRMVNEGLGDFGLDTMIQKIEDGVQSALSKSLDAFIEFGNKLKRSMHFSGMGDEVSESDNVERFFVKQIVNGQTAIKCDLDRYMGAKYGVSALRIESVVRRIATEGSLIGKSLRGIVKALLMSIFSILTAVSWVLETAVKPLKWLSEKGLEWSSKMKLESVEEKGMTVTFVFKGQEFVADSSDGDIKKGILKSVKEMVKLAFADAKR